MTNEFNLLRKHLKKHVNSTNSRGHVSQVFVDEAVEEKHTTSDGASMWAVSNKLEFFPCDETVDELPPGQYTIAYSPERGIFFVKRIINLDELLPLPDSASEEVIGNIEHFWDKENIFREFGFLWKRGILLWGPPGSGKTSCLQVISQKIIERGGISIYSDSPELDAKGLELLRRIEPDRPLVVMIEDIDAIIERHGESSLLALLDGELQIDNVVFVATTNYPERLDKRLINRPSRFDIVKMIGMPTPLARKMFFEKKHPNIGNDLDLWVASSKGFSIAHMKEMLVAVECLGQPFDDTVARLRAMIDISISSDDTGNKQPFGFTNQ